MRCRSFYVTYDTARPHGCRAFGFKSARLPSLEVRLTTGEECRAFERRGPPPTSAEREEPPWTSG